MNSDGIGQMLTRNLQRRVCGPAGLSRVRSWNGGLAKCERHDDCLLRGGIACGDSWLALDPVPTLNPFCRSARRCAFCLLVAMGQHEDIRRARRCLRIQPRGLRVPWQLDGFHLAADRHELMGHVHVAGWALDVRRRSGRGLGARYDRCGDIHYSNTGGVFDLPAFHHPRCQCFASRSTD